MHLKWHQNRFDFKMLWETIYCIPSNWSVQNRTFHDLWALISALCACPQPNRSNFYVSWIIGNCLGCMQQAFTADDSEHKWMRAQNLAFFPKTDRRDSWSIYCKICIIWAKLENWKLKCHQWWWSTFYYLCVPCSHQGKKCSPTNWARLSGSKQRKTKCSTPLVNCLKCNALGWVSCVCVCALSIAKLSYRTIDIFNWYE